MKPMATRNTRRSAHRRKVREALITAAFALAFTLTLILAHHWSYN